MIEKKKKSKKNQVTSTPNSEMLPPGGDSLEFCEE